jgi:precorrin-2 methylase
MSFSAQLIEELKTRKGFTKDSEVVVVLPKVTKGILSEIKNGKRNLTEEQAIWIAEECNLDLQWVLVNHAEETAKSDKAKAVWHNIAKKIAKAASALGIVGFLLVSQVSGQFPPQRTRSIR